MYRQTIDLTGTWRFQPDPAAAGEKLGYQNPENDASTWRNVKVPCCFESCAPGMDAYEGTGWNRHEDSPTADMTTDLITTRRDLLEMKEAGANFVRLCHYPHHPAELDLCDEIGLLVMDEIPLYWWQREDEGKENSLHKFEAASRQIERMIARDRNHPCVILWSVSNENDEEHDDVREGNQALIRLAQGLDPSRLSCHVSYCWMDHHNFSEDDVVCLNAYPSLFRLGPGLFGFGEQDQNNAFSQSTIFWQEGIKTMSETYPGKPVLVTEFGGCAIEGTWSSLYGEDTQATIIECEFAGMEAAAVCGTVIWCWADHAWPPGAFFNGLAISPFGVVTRERRKKAAYWTTRRLFRQRQGLSAG